jgi:hypothetical protein
MSPSRLPISLVALVVTISLVSASPSSIDGASYNKPSAGPSTAWFAGATSLPATQIASAAAAATKVPSDAMYCTFSERVKQRRLLFTVTGLAFLRCVQSSQITQ